MIVDLPPYDLVLLCADADALRLLQNLVERGQESGCLSNFRQRPVRDARRDPYLNDPLAVLRPFHSVGSRYIICWDHKGSGFEKKEAEEIEDEVTSKLLSSGFSKEDTCVVAIDPELEVVLVPSWDSTKKRLANFREVEAPSDEEILAVARRLAKRRREDLPPDFQAALATCPRELYEGLLYCLNLRPSPFLFQELGKRLSIPMLKQGLALMRISAALETWFPGPHIDERGFPT